MHVLLGVEGDEGAQAGEDDGAEDDRQGQLDEQGHVVRVAGRLCLGRADPRQGEHPQEEYAQGDTGKRRETRTGVQRREPCPIAADTMSGASAKPMLPPKENQLIALWLPSLASRATPNRSLDDLGGQIGASARTLSRHLRDDLGLTYPQWRTQIRLNHALVLLADDTPVTAVAHHCGWSSASTFIDVFRRTFGHTLGSRPTT
ncbi:helix-turn-helix transcriptional regulator [Streptomyces asoensis]|uniref:helix-turn-helix transcriptional regulator n=1 Tax=Streptomyces asoensis TaxID=249586 RepID=UPI0033C8671E